MQTSVNRFSYKLQLTVFNHIDYENIYGLLSKCGVTTDDRLDKIEACEIS